MNRAGWLLWVLMGFTGQVPAVTDVAGWHADLDQLAAAIRRTHPDPFQRNSQTVFEADVESIRQRLPQLSEAGAALEFQRLLAAVGDGHTEWVTLPESLGGHYLPLIVRRYSEGWFVRTGDPRYRALFAKPITAIAGRPIHEVVDHLAPYIAADNHLGKLDGIGNLMRVTRVLQALSLISDSKAPIELAVAEADGSQTRVEVQPTNESWVAAHWKDLDEVVNPQRPEPLSERMDGNYDCAWLTEQRLVYVRFDEIRDVEGQSIEEFFNLVYRFADRHAAQQLVLDLRENSGGNLDLNGPVLHGLLARPALNAPGRLFVLIGRDTYSAAVHLAAFLERHTPALFVGEPTGGSPNHQGDTLEMTLAHSGLRVEISELAWQNSDPRDRRPWIAPELAVTPSVAAYIAGHDPALDAVLNYKPTETPVHLTTPMARWRRPNQPVTWPELITPMATTPAWLGIPVTHNSQPCDVE